MPSLAIHETINSLNVCVPMSNSVLKTNNLWHYSKDVDEVLAYNKIYHSCFYDK